MFSAQSDLQKSTIYKLKMCVLFLPEPTGSVAIDSKFPLESYRKMLDTSLPPDEIKNAQKQFKLDIKKHI